MGQVASVALTAMSTFNQFSGEERAATAVMAQGRYEKAEFDLNASMAARQATDALERGEVAVSREESQARGVIGAEKAAYAAGGVDVSTGSPLDVEHNTRQMGEIDAMTLKNNAAREAWGFDVESADYTAKGQLALFAAEGKAAGIHATEISTLLTGAEKTYGIFADKKTTMVAPETFSVPSPDVAAVSGQTNRFGGPADIGTLKNPVSTLDGVMAQRKLPWENNN